MTAKVIRRIHKLRKHVENEARLALTVAERDRQRQEEVIQELNDAIERSREEVSAFNAEELFYQQGWVLRMELIRRGAEALLMEKQREVSRRRGVLIEAAKEARILERVAEVREEAAEQEERHRSGKVLDETGVQGWWGKRG